MNKELVLILLSIREKSQSPFNNSLCSKFYSETPVYKICFAIVGCCACPLLNMNTENTYLNKIIVTSSQLTK